MKISSPDRTFQDENGQWWYLFGPRRVRLKTYVLTCQWCKDEYVPPYRATTQRSRTCSKSCGLKLLNAEKPGRTSGENGGRWKGGKRIGRGGYVHVWKPDHPSLAGTKRKYVLEHRLVMEQHLGRPLKRDEYVHHLNGVRDDNRIENLELWAKHQPPGQREHQMQHCPTCTCFNCC